METKEPQKGPPKSDVPAESATPSAQVTYGVRAYKLYDVISLKSVKGIFAEDRIQPAPQGFIIPFKKESYLFLFRFGCVAFFNFSDDETKPGGGE